MDYNLAFINGKLDEMPSILEALNKWLEKRKAEILSPPIGIIEKYVSEEKSIFDAERKIGFIFRGNVESYGEIKVEKIREPDFKNVVVAIHRGSYKTLGRTYIRIFEYLNRNNYKFKLPYREIYFYEESKKKKNLIEIQIPIEKITH